MRTLPLFTTTISLFVARAMRADRAPEFRGPAVKTLILLASAWLLACASQSPLLQREAIGPDPRHVYQVELINEHTIAVRVQDPLTNRAVHVYPGLRAMLTLPSTSIHRRRLLLTVGSRTYQTMEFQPDAVLRCWTLTIDRSLMLATGGPDIAPCRDSGRPAGR
jgi:hypothetical protein